MTPHRINHNNASMNMSRKCISKPKSLVAAFARTRVFSASDRPLVSAATVLKPLVLPLSVLVVPLSFGTPLQAVDLLLELPLWEKPPRDQTIRRDVKEQVRSLKPRPGSPPGLNRVVSSVSSPTYSIHRPRNPNGVGLVICPGGGFRDVWLDRAGHDLAIWLRKDAVIQQSCRRFRWRTGFGTGASRLTMMCIIAT